MKRENHPIDDLFREALNDHPVAPSDASRSHFLEEASVGGIIKGTPRWPWLNIFLVAGFIGVAVFLYFLFSQKQGTTPGVTQGKATTANQTAVSTKTSSLSTNKNTTNKITTSTGNIKTISDQNKVPQTTESVNNGKSNRRNNSLAQTSQKPRLEVVDSPVQPANSAISEKKTGKLIVSNSSTTGPETKVVISPQETNPVTPELLPSQTNEMPGETPSSGDVNSSGQSGDSPEDKPEGSGSSGTPQSPVPIAHNSKKPVFTPYLRYNIEKSFNNDENLVHSLGVEGRLNYGRFYLQSGASFLVRNGQKHNRVQINEYLGNYKKLDSITFNWDQKQYHLLPSYHMSKTDVYDSTLKLDEYLVFKQYRKVRIPLMLGFEVLQKGRFTLAVQSGAEWDLYLGSDEKSGSYDAGQNKVVNIDNLPDPLARNLVYWKSDISIGCRITKRMILLAEPHVKYLLNPVESSSNEELKIWNPMLKGSLVIEF